ncbi:MAG: translation initiation factor IF-3 [bacterium]
MKEYYINERIRAREVRVVGTDGKQHGVLPLTTAISMAKEEGYDLVCVAPDAVPPVCKIADFGKLKYELTKKEKSGKKKDRSGQLKELKMRPKISEHDYQVRLNKAIELLAKGYKIKVTMTFRGREMTHQNIGRDILTRYSNEIKDSGIVETLPKMEGRNLYLILAPNKQGR